MVRIRRANERGHVDRGWLNSNFTFSFADYYDPQHMGFRNLRVINDDVIAPGRGFGMHPHQNMEIVTYVLQGGVKHQDSMGNTAVVQPGEVQRMSAGTGVFHSEVNASETEPLHLLQIWILPEREGIEPGYEQKAYSAEERQGQLRLVAAPDGREGAVTIHADAELRAALFSEGETAVHTLQPGRHAWVHVARGSVTLNGTLLGPGDGAAISEESRLELAGVAGTEPGEVLLFDLG